MFFERFIIDMVYLSPLNLWRYTQHNNMDTVFGLSRAAIAAGLFDLLKGHYEDASTGVPRWKEHWLIRPSIQPGRWVMMLSKGVNWQNVNNVLHWKDREKSSSVAQRSTHKLSLLSVVSFLDKFWGILIHVQLSSNWPTFSISLHLKIYYGHSSIKS